MARKSAYAHDDGPELELLDVDVDVDREKEGGKKKLDRPTPEEVAERVTRVLKLPGDLVFPSTVAWLVGRDYRTVLRWMRDGFLVPTVYIITRGGRQVAAFNKYAVIRELPRLTSRKAILVHQAARRARGVGAGGTHTNTSQ